MTDQRVAACLERLRPWIDGLRIRPARTCVIRYGRDRAGRRILAVDPLVLVHADAADVLADWLGSRGRQRDGVRDLIRRCEALRDPVPTFDLPAIDGIPDLEERLRRLHPGAAAGTPMPRIGWGRRTRGALRSIRFGSYIRATASIRIHPRLSRPWVADLFVDAVIHHELCHHRQAHEPVRGERVHSPRFRAWDRAFPGHADAERWLRSHLPRFLID